MHYLSGFEFYVISEYNHFTHMEILASLLLVFLFVFLNGYFVAAEFALVAVRKTRIDELVRKKNKQAKLVKRAIKDLDTYISATQLGITLSSLALGWIGEPALAHFFEPMFSFLPHNLQFISAHGVAVAIAFFIITFLHIVLGELAPKTLALHKAEAVSMLVIAPLIGFTVVFKPFIWMLNGAGNIVLRFMGYKNVHVENHLHSEEEISMIINESAGGGMLEKEEAKMAKSILKFGDVRVKKIMTPVSEIVSLSIDATLPEIEEVIEKNVHSRFPVYSGTIDTLVGFAHIKDLYKALVQEEDANKKLAELNILRKIINVPEDEKADDVMHDMRNKHVHMAIVDDEEGNTIGLVTFEDLIESFIGEVEDEFDIVEEISP